MTDAIGHLSTTRLVLLTIVGLIVLAIVAAFVGRALVRRGLREPFIVRLINRASENVIDSIRRPITIAVLDEVAEVLQSGHYTRNIAAALQENHEEIKRMFAEKIKQDPTARHIGLLPFHDRIINEASETTLRVLLEVLSDPRTDELVSDLLRDNITQIRMAVRARQDGLPEAPLTAATYRDPGMVPPAPPW
ncbi:MAG: hypothetical protein DLM57_13250 [Pseudonocardiales bacterium]|nr:MAG: hypothetical protein DLM57_13250 [Pseudonocardiales bacterium]